MPVDPRDLLNAAPITLDADRPCRGCGYNLRGLTTAMNCPECGRPIAKSRRAGVRYRDNLVNAPLGYLRLLSFGALLLAICGPGVVIAMLVSSWFAQAGVLAFAAAVFWWIGVLVVTRPRPVSSTTEINPAREWLSSRRAARLTQLAWVPVALSVALDAWGAPSPAAAVAAGWIALSSIIIAVVGVAPLCWYISNLAEWGSDSGLAHACRNSAWLIAAGAVVELLRFIESQSGLVGLLIGTIFMGILFVIGFFLELAAVVYVAVCLFWFQSTTRWAVTNHVIAVIRDERLRERAEQAADLPKPPAFGPVELGPIPLADDPASPRP